MILLQIIVAAGILGETCNIPPRRCSDPEASYLGGEGFLWVLMGNVNDSNGSSVLRRDGLRKTISQ